ncbi:NAD regulator [Phenylobacterium terrae]|uniref:NAD regulator n=1 Tax=Phenylobacterium terrae TaxID=2665495 RepID=A0ABW4N640_9CAUL
MMSVVIGLSAVIVAIRDGEAVTLTVRPRASELAGLPFGPFDPGGHRTFELALRAFVTEQTRFDLGYVEQLYTFGDMGRDAPLADMGDGDGKARVISVGYLALTPHAVDITALGAEWASFSRFFPWEDWRGGRPPALAPIEEALKAWCGCCGGAAEGAQRLARARLLFALDGAPWNEERVLERYELLYEAGLAPEAARDRSETPVRSEALTAALGEPMISDHRRILATALSRLRGKLKYRPVVFELMPEAFTLSALQRTVEAIAGVPLHKQNFRRALERADLVEGLGRLETDTGGRPAELFRFRRESLAARPVSGLSLPLLRE